MNRSLLSASWLAVARPPVLVPLGTAALLVAGTVPWQDGPRSSQVLHAVALLAACALAGATDDPAAEVAAASPYPRTLRTFARVGVALALTLPVVVLASLVAELRFAPTPLPLLLAEVAGLAAVGVATGTLLRARGLAMPAYPAVVGVLVLTVAAHQLPSAYVLVDAQPWGPPLEAALIRWAAVALLSAAVLAVSVRDPWERRVWFPMVPWVSGAPHRLQPVGRAGFPGHHGIPSAPTGRGRGRSAPS